MSTRSELALRIVSVQRRSAAELNRVAFLSFCDEFAIPPHVDALLLYFTQLHDSGASGRQLREQLSLLNLGERLQGRVPWGNNPDVQRLLLGFHQVNPIGRVPRARPLYRELVEVLVDAIMTPTPEQLRWRAAVLVANETSSSARALAYLRWGDVSLTKNRLRIRWPMAPCFRTQRISLIERATAPEAHTAMSLLKASTPDRSQAVFAAKGRHGDHHKILQKLSGLPPWEPTRHRGHSLTGSALEVLVDEAGVPEAQQLRDRALVLLSFGAALSAKQATESRVGSIRVTNRGLLVDIPSRRSSPIGLPSTDGPYCPTIAWEQWRARAARTGEVDDDRLPAFPLVFGELIYPSAMAHLSLLYVVRQRCRQAGFVADYVFTSLRSGWIRGALRDGQPLHEVAAHAGFRSLDGVKMHEHRENLLRDNVASRLGL